MPFASAGANITNTAQINPGVIVNSDINAAAAIDYSKLNLALAIVNGDISASAAIALSKLASGTQGGIMYRGAGGVMTELPAGTDGQVLVTKGAGANPIFQTQEPPNLINMVTAFEDAARFTRTNTDTGSSTFGTNGLYMESSSGSSTGSTSCLWNVAPKASTLYTNSPIFTARIYFNSDAAFGSTGSIYAGLGNPTVASASHTFTVGHTGFKLTKGGGVWTLYATQADGTTENVSSALTTVGNTDYLDLILKVRSTTSVDYYWSKNGGALSAATNLTANMPAGTSTSVQISTCAGGANCWNNITVMSASYQK